MVCNLTETFLISLNHGYKIGILRLSHYNNAERCFLLLFSSAQPGNRCGVVRRRDIYHDDDLVIGGQVMLNVGFVNH